MTLRRRRDASHVETYLGPRTFYTKDMENKQRVSQRGVALPPRCVHCRRSWGTTVVDGAVHCEEHRRGCDGACGIDRAEES